MALWAGRKLTIQLRDYKAFYTIPRCTISVKLKNVRGGG